MELITCNQKNQCGTVYRRGRSAILTVVFFLAIAGGFGLLDIKKASAWDCICAGSSGTIIRIKCNDTGWWPTQDCRDVCSKDCKDKGYSGGLISVTGAPPDSQLEGEASICRGMDTFSLELIKCILLYVLKFIGNLVQAGNTLFTWVVDSNNLKSVLSNSVIYTLWTNVRDTLNIAFILTLLFSAFCTVFQIEKYNYRKILLTLIIMALLVNFSFPITRVIIDFSNVIMYYFIQGLNLPVSKENSVFVQMAKNGGLQVLLNPQSTLLKADFSFLIAAIVFMFIFAVTLITIAILLLTRIIVLAVLIIFSSIAFVGSIIPFLSSQASKWWDNLFKYAFFGPIMIFMMSVALKMMTEIANLGKGSFSTISATQTTGETASTVAAMAFFSIPIVILWIGIGFAQSMSIAGASAVMGRANKFMGWSARTMTGYRPAKALVSLGISRAERGLAKTKYGKFLSPRVYKEAWERRSKEAEEKAFKPAIGEMQNLFNRLPFFGGPKTDYAKLERARLVNNQRKENEEVSQHADYTMDDMFDNMTKGSSEATTHMRAGLRTIFNNRDYDDFMWRIYKNLEEPAWKGGPTFKEMGFNKENSTVSQENILNAVEILLKKSGATNQEIIQEILDLGNISASNMGLGYGGVRYNKKDKTFRRTSAEEGAWLFASKLRTMGESQDLAKKMHRNIFTDEHNNLSKTGEEALYRVINEGVIKNADRHRPDFYNDVAGNDDIYNEIHAFADKLAIGEAELWNDDAGKRMKVEANETQASQIRKWIDTVRSKTGKRTRGFETKEEKKEPFQKVDVVSGFGSSREKTTFDKHGNPIT